MTKTETILASLSIMWKGMVGIFVTILIIMLVVWILGRMSGGNDKK